MRHYFSLTAHYNGLKVKTVNKFFRGLAPISQLLRLDNICRRSYFIAA